MGNDREELAARRLRDYLGTLGDALNNKKRRESFAMYAMGLLGSAERKSAEPIAAEACGDARLCEAYHRRLVRFLAESPWDDGEVRRIAARYALEAMSREGPIVTWVVDDTGFLKQGSHSVGVQRQYTGSAGKIANCQIGVSLSVATDSAHMPIDFELYLPSEWAADKARRAECRVPDAVGFRTKEELALDMIERAVRAELPGEIVLADSAYGRSQTFRDTLRLHGLDYAVGIPSSQTLWVLDDDGQPSYAPVSASELVSTMNRRHFRRVTWRRGTRGNLAADFAFRRVKTAGDDGTPLEQRESLWLIIEWRDGEARPSHFALTTLPKGMSKVDIVRLYKERYRTELVYEEMKGELGLDHFEGRSFTGWHHHVSVAICCYAFVVAERVRRFPPSGQVARANGASSNAA